MTRILRKLLHWVLGEPKTHSDSRESSREGASIDTCVCCRTKLPLRSPDPGKKAGRWQCVHCGYRYVAVIDELCHDECLANVRPVSGDENTSPNFSDFVDSDVDRRVAQRASLETILLVSPLDDSMEPIADAFLCRTADFSATGVRIVHSEPIKAKWLILEHLTSNSERVQVLVHVSRFAAIDEGYEIGASFVSIDTMEADCAATIPTLGITDDRTAHENAQSQQRVSARKTLDDLEAAVGGSYGLSSDC